MGRKNRNASRRNIKGRLDRREAPQVKRRTGPAYRPPLEKIVMPDGQCHFPNRRKPKVTFLTEEKAAKALAQAQAKRRSLGDTRYERRYYRCEPIEKGGCGGFHLSARETWQESTK